MKLRRSTSDAKTSGKMTEPVYIGGRSVDLSHPDVVFLVDYVVEVQRELENAKRYLEDCRRAVGAHEGEMLIDAIRRCREREQRQSPHRGVGH